MLLKVRRFFGPPKHSYSVTSATDSDVEADGNQDEADDEVFHKG